MMSSISLWCPVWKTQICDFGDFKPDQKAVSESKAAVKQSYSDLLSVLLYMTPSFTNRHHALTDRETSN